MNRTEGLYLYNIRGRAAFLVRYDESRNWNEISTTIDTVKGIQVVYEQHLSQTSWNTNTTFIQFCEAIGYDHT